MPVLVFIPLVILWAIAYVVGILTCKPDSTGHKRIPLWTKITMILITLLVAGLWLADRFPFWTNPALGISLGLIFGAVGDLILANVFRKLEHPEISAMIVFGIGHIFYISAALGIRRYHELGGVGPLITAGISGMAALIGWRVLVYNSEGSRSLNIGSLIYGIILFMATGFIIALWVESGMHFAWALGIILFTISDIILAQSLIRKQGTEFMRDIIWLIYSSGQMLIAYSLGGILKLITLDLPFI